MIKVNNVSMVLNKYRILDNVSLDIKKGEAVGLVGGNGSGKRGLMKCICGLNTRYNGEIVVNNKIIGKDEEFAPDTGFIIEVPGFIPGMSGYQNLSKLAGIRKKIDGKEIKKWLEMVGLDPDDKRSVKKYSMGMRQRLGLAQALMENPEILILDEPFNGLDKDMVIKMRDILVEQKRNGKTILLTSHNQQDRDYVCDRMYEIDGGGIIAS